MEVFAFHRSTWVSAVSKKTNGRSCWVLVSVNLWRKLLLASSFEVVNHDLLADSFENLFDKFYMIFVNLVSILGGLVLEGNIQCHLITLIHHRAITGCHPPHMKKIRAGNVL